MVDYAKELGAMGKGPMMGKGKGMMADEESDGDDYSAAKEAAGMQLAEALGIDASIIDARALCDAVKAIIELEE